MNLFNLKLWSDHQIRPRVLVIDDEKDLADLFASTLEDAGAIVRTANDGNEAFGVVEDFLPDLIIADLKMPMVRGDELLVELRRQGYQIPIIVVTGHSDEDVLVKCLRYGAFDFLSKPVDIDLLVAAAGKALDYEYDRLFAESFSNALLEAYSSQVGKDAESLRSEFKARASAKIIEARKQLESWESSDQAKEEGE